MPMCSCIVCLKQVTPVLCNAGPTEELWKELWDVYGKCTLMTIAEYFTFIATAFNEYDANVSTERCWETLLLCTPHLSACLHFLYSCDCPSSTTLRGCPASLLQRALATANIDLEANEQRVDRDRLLKELTFVWKKKAWAACNNK